MTHEIDVHNTYGGGVGESLKFVRLYINSAMVIEFAIPVKSLVERT